MAHHKVWSVRVFWLFLTLILLSAAGEKLWSQALTGYILGTVRDASGAVVPGAKVDLTQVETGAIQTQVTDSLGNYLFAKLDPAHYTLHVSKEGFQTKVIADIELLVGQAPRIDVTLQVGQVSQQVEVNAGGVQLLDTQTSTVGQVIQSKPIVGLPLNGRNFIQLTELAPLMNPELGTKAVDEPGSFWTGAGYGNTRAMIGAIGVRDTNVSFLLDGIETRSMRWGTVTIKPSPDAIQEFKMETTDFGPETGRSSVVVNLALKSGSNKVHGTAFEFLRNSGLDAGDFFLNLAGQPKNQFQQNNFGFTLGGPVVLPHVYNGHDKLFFFINYEGFRSRKGGTGLNALYPSAAQLAGDLADDSAGTGIFPTNSPFCQANAKSPKCLNVINPFTGQPFPGNVIPAQMLDPQSQAWIPFIHRPNVAGAPNQATSPSFNFSFSPKNRDDFNQTNNRFDYDLSANDRFYGSYSYEDVPHTEPGLAILGGVSFPWQAQVLALNETHIFSPSVVNEFRYGFKRSHNARVAETAFGPVNYEADVFKLKNFGQGPVSYAVPNALIAGFGPVGGANIPQEDRDQTHQFVDNLSIVRGRHNVKLGGTVYHERILLVNDCSSVPQFTFDGRFTHSGLADMLLGIPFEVQGVAGEVRMSGPANYYAGYLGDDIRARPDLTLNLGIRYEYQQWPRDDQGREEIFDQGVGRVVSVFRGEIRNGIVDPDYHEFAPRVGLAYSPSFLKNTTIRSSFGIFYGTDQWNEFDFAGAGPDFLVDCTFLSNPAKPTLLMRDQLPSSCTTGVSSAGLGIFGMDRRNRIPYIEEWNLDVQHSFANNWLLEVGYVGNQAHKLLQRQDYNTPSFDPTGTIPVAARRPIPQWGDILGSNARGWSSYNGGFIKVEKRVTAGGYVLASYTYSRAEDLGTAGGNSGGTTASRNYDVYDRGRSVEDTPQRFVASYVYGLPFGRGQRLLSGASGAADKLVGGWSVEGITTFQSGQYTDAVLGFDFANLGPFTVARPNVVGPYVPSNRSYNNWWVKSGFALPGCSTLTVCPTAIHIPGNEQRQSLEVPGLNNWDLALMKDTKLSERTTLQFRAESFNTWNHPQFGAPNGTLNSPNFGKITSLFIPSREVQFGLKLLW